MEIILASPQKAVASDLPAIAALMSAAFEGGEDWEAKLRWLYLENPEGEAIYINAHDENGELIGHYAVIPAAPFADPRFAGIRTYHSLNTAVHPRAQGKGLFKRTAQAVYDFLTSLGPHVVLGVANENSVHGFISSLGFYLLGQLKVEAYFPGTSPRSHAPRLLAPKPEAVRWRLGRPGGGYQISKSGQVACTRHFKGLPVHCLVTSGGLDTSLVKLPSFGLAARCFRPAIFATYGPTSQFAWIVPEALRPSPFHLICRASFEGSPLLLLNHIQTHRFEFFDFDVV